MKMTQQIDSNVELKVPVKENYVSVVRLLVSGLANRLGLPIDELENLKLMIGEAFLAIVDKCEQTNGLITLRWKEQAEHITVSLSDPSGKHKSVTNTASLALLKRLGGTIGSEVIDGVEILNLDFDIKYSENRPFIFNDDTSGRA
jgi:hypothetical protein